MNIHFHFCERMVIAFAAKWKTIVFPLGFWQIIGTDKSLMMKMITCVDDDGSKLKVIVMLMIMKMMLLLVSTLTVKLNLPNTKNNKNDHHKSRLILLNDCDDNV